MKRILSAVVVGALVGGAALVTTAAPAAAIPVTFATTCRTPGLPDARAAEFTVDAVAPATAPQGSEVELTDFNLHAGATGFPRVFGALTWRGDLVAPGGEFVHDVRVDIPVGGGVDWPTGTGRGVIPPDAPVGSRIEWRIEVVTMSQFTFLLPVLWTCTLDAGPSEPFATTTVTARPAGSGGGRFIPGQNIVVSRSLTWTSPRPGLPVRWGVRPASPAERVGFVLPNTVTARLAPGRHRASRELQVGSRTTTSVGAAWPRRVAGAINRITGGSSCVSIASCSRGLGCRRWSSPLRSG